MLNFTIAVAEASLDTDLLASPNGEAELAIVPVALMESVVHIVSLKYWSAIKTGEDRRNEDVPLLWRRQKLLQQMKLSGQRWPVATTNETMAGMRKSCTANCRLNVDVD